MADFFIDPSAAMNGSGSAVSPYNTWVGVTLTANNRYFQKRGTIYVGAPVRPQNQSSAAGTPLTIGAYYFPDGTDDSSRPLPIVDHNGGSNGAGAIMVDTCQNVVVQDMLGTNSKGFLGAGVLIRRSQKVLVQRCVGWLAENGFSIHQDQASATSTCTDITIDSCVARSNVSAGIVLRNGAVSTAVLKRITLTNNLIVGNGTGKTTGSEGSVVPAGGIMAYTVHKSTTAVEYRNYDYVITDNRVQDNLGYGINIEAVGNETLVSRVSHNEISGCGISLDIDSHCLWAGNSFGVEVLHNYIHDNFARAGFASGSGVGIFIDYNGVSSTGGADCIVRGNVIARQFKGVSLASTPSPGIAVLANNNTIVEGNIIVDCRNGITVGPAGAGGTDGTLVRNNLLVDIVDIGIANTTVTNTNVRDNIISGAALGLFCSTTSTAGYAEGSNILHNCAELRAQGTPTARVPIAADPSNSIADPLIVDRARPWLGLKAGSPAWGSGIPIQGAKDRYNRRYSIPPNIGPWAVQSR